MDGAIPRAAGPALLAACRALHGCPTGAARLTPGFNLPAKWVIHTVGPIWRGGGEGEPALLRACYRESLALAVGQGARRIAFPAISTGVYGYPKVQAATIAISEMRAWEASFEEIIGCCFSDKDVQLYRRVLAEPQSSG